MKSFVVKLDEFFKLQRSNISGGGSDDFTANKRHLLIPMYQREYKWDEYKIQCLINDIADHEKFLGIIILDESGSAHEIVDGQQRITTCFLVLMAMYNLYRGETREQQHIISLMQPYDNRFILSNDSVGEYISMSNERMSLCIADANDMFFQKNKFDAAYQIIFNALSEMRDNDALRSFQQKLRACEILVMINETHTDTQPIEQVFLDINEKSQLLDVEDIFKGHCFENFTDNTLHAVLRQYWTDLKRFAMKFVDFGYKDLSQYLYHYLLVYQNKSLPETLSPNGRHILAGKTMDYTENLLKSMIEYGKTIIEFRTNIGQVDYRFANICPDSQAHSNTNDHIVLKQMATEIFDTKTALYQKLPFFVLIHILSIRNFSNTLTHDMLRKIFTNVYIYASLFIMSGSKKAKSVIDTTIREALNSENAIPETINAAKQLRITSLESFEFKSNFKSEALEFVFSVIDFYSPQDNWLTKKYTKDNDYTLEHFIIPDNRSKKIKWRGCSDFDILINNAVKYKKLACNFIILPQVLNEQLGHDDIIRKITDIRSWYTNRNEEMPPHINIFIEHIETLPTYQNLQNYQNTTTYEIECEYNNFIEEYFNEERQISLCSKIQQAFRVAFTNNS